MSSISVKVLALKILLKMFFHNYFHKNKIYKLRVFYFNWVESRV